MVLKILYSIITFLLFAYVFLFKLIKKNDTMYVTILVLQALGILINFIQITSDKMCNTFFYVLMFLLSLLLPICLIIVELKGKNFVEMIYVITSKILLFLGFTKKTKEVLNKLLRKYPKNYYAHKTLAKIYEDEGGMRKAIDEYVKALEIKSDDYNSYFRIAFLLNELKRKDESIEMLKTLIKKKPDYYEANSMISELLIEKEKYREAISTLIDAIKQNPNKEELCYKLGIAYSFINDFSRAKQCFERAIKINSDLFKAYYKLGQIALLYRDIENAEKYFTQSIYEENEAKAYYQLSKISVIKNDKIKASFFIDKAISLDEKIYERAKNEPVLFPIKESIKKPQSLDLYNKDVKPRNMQSKIEEKIEEYLDDTYTLTKQIGKNNY